MGLFDNMLKEGESVFKNEDALEFEFVPKLMPYREAQQHEVARAIKPMFAGRSGKNLFIHGPPGIGKTAAIRWVFRDLEDTTDQVIPLYVNCWKFNTSYKILMELCHQLGYKFTQNKKTDDLLKIVKQYTKDTGVVFAFDEVDKLEDLDFIYLLAEEIPSKAIIMITNFKSWIAGFDKRIKSRLMAELLEFKQYNKDETAGIIKERIGYAFMPGVWKLDALNLVVDQTATLKDLRSGMYLLKEAGYAAEQDAAKHIEIMHAKKAVEKVSGMQIKDAEDLDPSCQQILALLEDHSGKKIGDLYKVFAQQGGSGTYKTFQRKVDKLAKNKFISVEKKTGGTEGTTTLVFARKDKSLADY